MPKRPKEWPEPDMIQTDLFPDNVVGTPLLVPEIHINDVKKLQELVQDLWSLLDDIDTVGDIAKDDNELYRNTVETIHAKRWNTGLKSDGYELYYDKK